MPVQLVILGVTVTLLGVLLVHLLFTIRYHLPLSKTNYTFQVGFKLDPVCVCVLSVTKLDGLQTSAVVLSLANVSAQLRLVMTNLEKQGRRWPYTYDYSELDGRKFALSRDNQLIRDCSRSAGATQLVVSS